jgi:hypothetical protein
MQYLNEDFIDTCDSFCKVIFTKLKIKIASISFCNGTGVIMHGTAVEPVPAKASVDEISATIKQRKCTV